MPTCLAEPGPWHLHTHSCPPGGLQSHLCSGKARLDQLVFHLCPLLREDRYQPSTVHRITWLTTVFSTVIYSAELNRTSGRSHSQDLSDTITKGTFTGPQNSPAVCFPSHLRDSEMVVSRHTGWGHVPKLQPGPPHHTIPFSLTSTLEALYLDMHPGPAQQAQCGISGTVNPQGHLLPQLLQAPLQLGPPAGKEFWRALTAPPHQPEGWQGGKGMRETVLGTDLVLRARLELTCVSPAHCVQTCQCQEERK